MKDVNGRDYARLIDLRIGDWVQVDDGFDCMEPNGIREVEESKTGMGACIRCTQGMHNLIGQLAADGIYLIGIYKIGQ